MSALHIRLSQFVLFASFAVAASAAERVETAPAPRLAFAPASPFPRGEPLLFEQNASDIRISRVNWWSVSVSPDGKRIATAEGDSGSKGEVKIWDRKKGTVIRTIPEPKGTRTVAFSPDGKTLATGNYDAAIRIYDAVTFELKAETTEASGGHKIAVNGLSFFKNGQYLASAGLDKTSRIWDVAATLKKAKGGSKVAPQPVAIFEGHTEGVLSVSVSNDGRTLLSGGFDKTGRCYDMPDPLPAMGEKPAVVKKERVLLQGHNAAVEAVAVSPDGKLLATGSWDAQLIIRESDGRTVDSSLRFNSGVMCLAFSKDGKRLAAGCGNMNAPDQVSEVRVWDVAEKKQLASRSDYPGPVLGVAFAADGKDVVSVGPERSVQVWPFEGTEKDRRTFDAPGANFKPQPFLAAATHGDRIALSGVEGKSVYVIDRKKNELVAELAGHEDVIAGLAFSPDGKTLATASYDKTVKLWNTATWKERKTLKGHTGWVLAAAFSPDGKTLATGGYDKTVRLWKAESGEPAGTWEKHTAGVRSVAFSPDGTRFASAGSDRTVRLWNIADGAVLFTMKGHKGSVRSVAFSPDGTRLASGSEDRSVKLWNAETGKEMSSYGTLPEIVSSVAFSPKGTSLAAGTFQGAVVLLDPLTGRTRQTLRFHGEPVTFVQFADGGEKLLSVSHDRTIKLCSALKPSSATPVQFLRSKVGVITAAAISPKGRIAAIGNAEGQVSLWEVKSGEVQPFPAGSQSGGIAHLALAEDSRIAVVGKEGGYRVCRLDGTQSWTGKGQFAAFAPNGKSLAVAEGKDIVLREAATGKEQKRLTGGHEGNVAKFTFSPDGTRLLSAGEDTKLRLWDAATGEKQQETPPFGNYSTVLFLSFSPDGTRFAAAAFGPDQPPPDDMTGNFRQIREVRIYPVPAAGGTFPPQPVTFVPQPIDQPIAGLEWTANGQSLVMPASDGTVRINEVAAGTSVRETQRYRAHEAPILASAISIEAGSLVTAGEDLTVRRWKLPGSGAFNAGQARITAPGLTRVWQMLPSPDGKFFVAAGEGDKTLRVFSDLPSGIPVEPERNPSVLSMVYSPDNRYLVTGHDKGLVVVREAATGKALRTLPGLNQRVLSLGFAEQGAALVAVGGNVMNGEEPGEAIVWDFAAGTVRHKPAAPVLQWMLAVHPNGKTFAGAGNDGVVRIWSAATGKLEKELTKGGPGLYSVAYDSTGRRLAAASASHAVFIWEASTGKLDQTVQTNRELRPCRALFSPDDREIVVSSWRGNNVLNRKPEIAAYSLENPEAPPRLFSTHPASVMNIAFLPDGKTLVASGGEATGGSLRAYDYATAKPVGTFTGHPHWAQSLAVSPDGRWIASTAWGTMKDGDLRLWNARGLRPIAEVPIPLESQYTSCAALDPSGKLLVLGSWGQSLTAWDISDPARPVLKLVLKEHTASLRSVAFDNSGKRFVSADESGVVKVWNAATLEVVASFKAAPHAVYRAKFTPDGKSIVTVGGNWQAKVKSEMKVWDAATGRETGKFPEQTREVWDLVFLNGGKQMAAIHTPSGAAGDANIKVWDFEKKEVVRTALPPNAFANARCLGLSPDGKRLAIGSSTGPVKVLDTNTWQEILSLPDLKDCTFNVNFTRDGKTLAIASGDGAAIAVPIQHGDD